MPDNAKGSSMRGLFDEERLISESLFAVKQHIDTRFIELYARDHRSNSKRFGNGRIGVSFDGFRDNVWTSNSELAIAGRPLGQEGALDLGILRYSQGLYTPVRCNRIALQRPSPAFYF